MIIGLSGYGGSGKDTIADILVEKHGFVRFAFADAMREGLLAFNPYLEGSRRLSEVVNELGWDKAKRQRPEIRRLLQSFGTDFGRNILGEQTWVNILNRFLQDNYLLGYLDYKVVVTDVRFPNEVDEIKGWGGRLWRVERSGVEPAQDHFSDKALDNHTFDLVIKNDMPLTELTDYIADYVRVL